MKMTALANGMSNAITAIRCLNFKQSQALIIGFIQKNLRSPHEKTSHGAPRIFVFGLAAVGADWFWSGCDGVLRWEIK